MIVGRISMIALSMVSPVALRPECSIARKPLTHLALHQPPSLMAHLRLLLVCLYFEQLAGVLWKPSLRGSSPDAQSASSARWSGQEAVRGNGHLRYYDGGSQEKDSGWYGAGLIVFASHVRSSSWHGLSVVRSSFWYGLSLARSLHPSPFPRARPLLCLSGRGGVLRWPAILMQRSN